MRTLRPSAWIARAPSVAVGGLCLAVDVAVNTVMRHESGRLSGDAPYYARMADHPAGPHTFPYVYRIGLPHLVHWLPFRHSFSWELLALLCAAAAGGGLFALLRHFELDVRLATALALALTTSPPVLVELLRNGLMVDVAAACVIVYGCLFIVRRQRLALFCVLLIGITIHESCTFLVPLSYALWARRPIDLKALRDVALTAFVPLALYVLLRSSIVALGQEYPGDTIWQEALDTSRIVLAHGGWWVQIRRIALDFGPLWLLAALSLRSFSFARRGTVLVLTCAAATMFATDWGRAMFFSAPVIYVAAARVLDQRRRWIPGFVGLLLVMNLGYAVYMQLHGVQHGLDTNRPPSQGPVY